MYTVELYTQRHLFNLCFFFGKKWKKTSPYYSYELLSKDFLYHDKIRDISNLGVINVTYVFH